MPGLVKVTDHEARAVGRLTSQYQKPKFQALAGAFAKRTQEAEDAFWLLLSKMNIDDATGDLLTKIGKMLGEERQGRGDTDLRVAVRIRALVNRSFGRSIDIVAIAVLAAVNAGDAGTIAILGAAASLPHYRESYPANWDLDIVNLPGGVQLARLLGEAKAAGSRGTLTFTDEVGAMASPIYGLTWGLDGDGSPLTQELWPDEITPSPVTHWPIDVECTP